MKINHSHRTRGQSLVEMALLLPVLLLISVVTIDMGRGIYYYSAIYNAAREGARYGIIDPTDDVGIKDAAKKLAIGLDLNDSDIAVTLNTSNPEAYTIQVDINYSFELVTPLAEFFLPCGCTDFQLHTSSTMLVEQ